jgi:peptidoglycan/xylan/chitin deacetylase (PgdA/CDA1 family)
MYHKVDPSNADMLTVTSDQLEAHLSYLLSSGYQIVSIKDIIDNQHLKKKSVVLTFDDAYLNNLEYAYPILKKYQVQATIFVPSAYIGLGSNWDLFPEKLLSINELKNIDHSVFDLALHTHTHSNFSDLSIDQIEEELKQNINFFETNNLTFVPALAYPYGGRPQDKNIKQLMYNTMSDLGIRWAFRIGNRLNMWPLKNRYEIERLDIRGTDSMATFKRKLKWGKLF